MDSRDASASKNDDHINNHDNHNHIRRRATTLCGSSIMGKRWTSNQRWAYSTTTGTTMIIIIIIDGQLSWSMILLVMSIQKNVSRKTFICRVCEFGGDDCVHNESVEDTRIPTKYCSMIIVNITMILNIKTPRYPSSMRIRMSQKTFFLFSNSFWKNMPNGV